MPASLPDLPTDHTGKLFRIVYITLTGVIDTIISVSGPWSWVRKSVSYLFKLVPLLWWALPAKTPAQVTPENEGWPPETGFLTHAQFYQPLCTSEISSLGTVLSSGRQGPKFLAASAGLYP
ncbi:hypothetical protein DSO57_1022649 [Entomophthora muscae]|uniref:Uncharacterized protein n=1 Tax=Entomophthora muscae TaxID=34485 RepID=A0ACC2T359_9FUNG|nr:hypothetical protein DSO57_1022649 [Entomophthora muscae]